MIDENQLLQTILKGSDWNEVLANIVTEEGLDPWNIDIVKLTDTFVAYLQRLKTFDFRIPARFVLIAAVLLRMKCELLIVEEKEEREKKEELPIIDLDKIPILGPPVTRKPTRKVTLDELISALNKAMDFKERKETKKMVMRRAVETLIEPEEDIGTKIKKIFEEITTEIRIGRGTAKFSKLVRKWGRIEIVSVFVPLLHIIREGKIDCEQEEPFQEIYIRFPENKKEVSL